MKTRSELNKVRAAVTCPANKVRGITTKSIATRYKVNTENVRKRIYDLREEGMYIDTFRKNGKTYYVAA